MRLNCILRISFALLTTAGTIALAQTPRQVTPVAREDATAIPADRGSAALWQSLQKLHTRASMLMITAHPDDEDGGALAYVSRGLGGRVALLTLNRGEGGANVMSSDYWDALGLVRTEELLQADRYYGVQQYFSSVVDYGFSKTKKEALEKWGHDRVLYDAVRVVRLTRPLVVTSVFVGGPSDGHGNHATAGQMAQEVFKAAGDPNIFPDQIKAGLLPWSPVKEYARVPFSLEKDTLSPKGLYDYATHHWEPAGVENYISGKFEPGAVSANVEIPEGEYNPLIGLAYQQLSREGLGFQKSQNGGPHIPFAGPQAGAYHRFGSRIQASNQENSFFAGIDTSLPGIATLAEGGNSAFLKDGLIKINQLVEQAITNFSAPSPEKIAPTLAQGLQETNELVTAVQNSNLSETSKYNVLHELKVKQTQFNSAICEALGLSLQAYIVPAKLPQGPFARFMGVVPSFQMAIPGQKFTVNMHLANVGTSGVAIQDIFLESPASEEWKTAMEGMQPGQLNATHALDVRFAVTVPEKVAYTAPYFSRPDIEQPYYDIYDKKYANLPLKPYPLKAWVHFTYHHVSLQVGEVVQTVESLNGKGLAFHPMPVAPAISVTISPNAGIVPISQESFEISALLHSNVKGPAKGQVHLELPAGWRAEPATANFSTEQDGENESIAFHIYPAHLEGKPYTIKAIAEYNDHSYAEGYTTVGYEGLRPYFLYKPASYRTIGVDVKVAPNLTVGYIVGSGDDVPASLENLGVHVHFISAQDLASADLSKYDAIVLGVRAYAVRKDLVTYNYRLLDYVKNGGVAIVQYNTPEFDHNYGPYPYVMTSDPEEVTDENSAVQILDPQNPVLNWPNKITSQDFSGWVEERGSKFLQSWDPHYDALLETHDPEQAPQKGGLLYARYGKGIYIYNAYAFYRELPEGVPGAYRLFANMLSLSKSPDFSR